jgi:hypothetical protein
MQVREQAEGESFVHGTIKIAEPRLRVYGFIVELSLVESSSNKSWAFDRALEIDEYGWWLHRVCCCLSYPRSTLAVVSGHEIVALSYPNNTGAAVRWFDLGSRRAVAEADPAETAAQLRFINSKRNLFQGPLDPVASGWTAEDIRIEAVAQGWISTK